MRASVLPLLAVASLAQCFPHPARAALGGATTVADATGAQLKLAVRQPSAAWRIQDATLPSGTVVHEYVATLTGKVFAVSWRGPAMPDLKQFLGGYYGRYQTAAQTPAVRHRLVRVEAADLVIQSAGRMRDFAGRAWLPAQLPAGFSVNDVQ